MLVSLHTKFSYAINKIDGGVNVVLTEIETSREKIFYLAGEYTEFAIQGLQNHLNSLTDQLCSEWFKTKDHKKSKKE